MHCYLSAPQLYPHRAAPWSLDTRMVLMLFAGSLSAVLSVKTEKTGSGGGERRREGQRGAEIYLDCF